MFEYSLDSVWYFECKTKTTEVDTVDNKRYSNFSCWFFIKKDSSICCKLVSMDMLIKTLG